MPATRSEIKFEVHQHHAFISQKLKKLQEDESLPFGPSCAVDFLQLKLNLSPFVEEFILKICGPVLKFMCLHTLISLG